MVKPVAGEIVVIPFPRTDSGKQRPALVIADLPGADLILCQITSRAHWDAFAVPLDNGDCERGEIGRPCFIRPQRLFTVEQHDVPSLSWKSDRREIRRGVQESAHAFR